MSTLALVWDLIAVDNASGTFRKVGAEAEGASGAVGKLATALGAAALGAAVGASVKSAADFQASMLLIRTQAQDTTDNLGQMSDAILKMAGETAQAPEALANSLYHVTSTGIRGAQALDEVRAAAELATVAHANLEETTNALTSVIASGIPGVNNFTEAVGVLNATVGSGDMKMSDLNEALSTGVLQNMKGYGLSIQDVGAALATFGDVNVRGAEASTQLRMAVQAMAVPIRGGQEILDELGITTAQVGDGMGKLNLKASQLADDMQHGGLNAAVKDLYQHLLDAGYTSDQFGTILTEVFGKRAGPGLANLLQQYDRLQTKYADINKAQGDFGDAWDQTTKTAKFQFDALKDSIEAAGTKLGTALLPPLSDAAKWLSGTGIPTAERFASSVKSAFEAFVNNPQVKTVLGEVGQGLHTIISAAGDIGRVVMDVFRTVGPAAIGATLTVVGGLAKALNSLPGPLRDMVVAFALLKATGGLDWLITQGGRVAGVFKDMYGATAAGVLQMRTSFGIAKQAMEDVFGAGGLGGTMVSRSVSNLAGFGAAAGEVAKGGLSALKTAGSGIVSMLGGPWGAALAGAAVAIGLYESALQHVQQAQDRWVEALKQGGSVADQAYAEMANPSFWDKVQYNLTHLFNTQKVGIAQAEDVKAAYDKQYASLDQVGRAQLAVTQATQRYTDIVDRYGADSLQAKAASDQLAGAEQNLTTQQNLLNEATKTHLQRMKDIADANRAAISDQFSATKALDDFNAAVKLGTTDQATLAQMADAAAQAAGRYAADQAKANGVQDTTNAYNQAYIKTLQGLVGQLDGPTAAAIQGHIDAIDKTVAHNGNLNDIIDKLHLNFRNTWDDNVKIIDGATPEMETQLRNLGLTVTELPGMPGHPAQILVTANTDPAYQQLNDFLKQAQALGFVGAIFGVSPTGQGPMTGQGGLPGFPPVNNADGGLQVGPGTGTSDSILSWLSNGEYVVKASQTAKHLPLLHAINNDLLPKYADGGAVWPAKLGPLWTDAMAAALERERQIATAAAAGGGNVQQFAGVAMQALAMEGYDASPLPSLLRRMNQESGGNPAAINLWDSNAAAGTPSVGLMQVIGPTYQSHKDPRADNPPFAYNVSEDPLSNIAAAIRYTAAAYGSLQAGWDRSGGYDTGGWLLPGVTRAFNGTGRPERIRTADQEAALQKALAGQPLVIHMFDADNHLIGTMRGVAQRENTAALSTMYSELAYRS